jgi:hypothetical protein
MGQAGSSVFQKTGNFQFLLKLRIRNVLDRDGDHREGLYMPGVNRTKVNSGSLLGKRQLTLRDARYQTSLSTVR